MSRSWADDESAHLSDDDRAIARLALVLARAPDQVDESLVSAVLGPEQDEKRLIRVLAHASLSAALRLASCAAAHLPLRKPERTGNRCSVRVCA